MAGRASGDKALFDEWPDRYDQWFTTPIGQVIKACETDVLVEMLAPRDGELLLDVGCGTGIFTKEMFQAAAALSIVGMDLSLPMLQRAAHKTRDFRFSGVVADMLQVPFADETFDRVYSMTALEFVADAQQAIDELTRVTRRGGIIVVTTLNSLSPWAHRRKEKAAAGHSLFTAMTFRSPQEMSRLVPGPVRISTAVHFAKDESPHRAVELERQGREEQRDTGAMLAMSWQRP